MKRFLQLLGPGLLYAGAAIGVSHLVQSTRAGAQFGFELMWILLATNLLKFPFFEIGSRYVLATGNNLITAYFKQSKWILWLFMALTLTTMFPVQAALTIVTAGLANSIFPSSLTGFQTSAILLLITLTLLMIGKFKLLDKIIKLVILLLTLSTLVAVVAAIGNSHSIAPSLVDHFSWVNKTHIIFLIAFIGWMPAPVDIVVWSSLWSQSKNAELEQKPSLKEALIEFRTGYFGTMIIAAFFLALGALVMYGSGEQLSPKGDVFADQLINMYTKTIGQWAYPVIALAAFTTMFSTTITVADAYPRTISSSIALLFPSKNTKSDNFYYTLSMLILAAGALVVLNMAGSMGVMVQIATTLSFVTSPALAYLNFKVITSKDIPLAYQPAPYLKIWTWIGIVFLSLFTLFYLVWILFF